MKFNVSSTALFSRLQSAAKVIASKNALPILDCFLFSVEDSVLTITSSDAEIRIVTSVEIQDAEGEKQFAVAARTLLEVVKELPEQPLFFEINEENLEIFMSFQGGNYRFIGQPGDAFPLPKPIAESHSTLNVNAELLCQGLTKTFFATGDDELRPIMNGVFFDITPEGLTYVASDGHKMVCMQDKTISISERASFVLGKKPANLLKSLFSKEPNDVEIKFDNKYACFKSDSYEVNCRLIEGRFPNYASIIQKNNPYKVTIDKTTIINALKRVSIFTNLSTGLIKISIENDVFQISGQDVEISSSAQESLPCQYSGEPVSIGFKGVFLSEMLSYIDTNDVVIELGDATRPAMILPLENVENTELLMLLMPMMLND